MVPPVGRAPHRSYGHVVAVRECIGPRRGRSLWREVFVHTAVRSQEFKWALEIKQSSKLCTRYRYASVPPLSPTWLGLGPGLGDKVRLRVRVRVRVRVSGEG